MTLPFFSPFLISFLSASAAREICPCTLSFPSLEMSRFLKAFLFCFSFVLNKTSKYKVSRDLVYKKNNFSKWIRMYIRSYNYETTLIISLLTILFSFGEVF